jgi:hypothetical protein
MARRQLVMAFVVVCGRPRFHPHSWKQGGFRAILLKVVFYKEKFAIGQEEEH